VEVKWWQEPKWLALGAAQLGFLLDAMDVLFYVFALSAIRAELGLSNEQAGLVSGLTLVTSAAGGMVAGALADRWGRRRTLIYTILVYSLASGGAATAGSLGELLFWRGLVGLGLGGEWAAGAVLVAEWWPAAQRGKAMGVMQSGWALGYLAAAGISGVVIPRWGWRVLFLIGILPALATIVIRRKVQEPAVWLAGGAAAPWTGLFRGALLGVTARATATALAVLLGYWGLFTWLPTFLAAPPSEGGAGLGMAAGSRWMMVMQLGALAGYVSFGWLSDRWGRRPVFAAYVLTAAALTPVYGLAPGWAGERAAAVLLALSPLLGFAGSGYFSLFGAMLAELFPTPLRGIGLGFSYNFGRALCALAPWGVGAVADRAGYGVALLGNAAFFGLAAALIFTLPETHRRELS
jgi:MFS family permease